MRAQVPHLPHLAKQWNRAAPWDWADHANFGVKFHKFQPVLQNLGQIYGESNPSPLVSFLKIGHRKCQFSKLETSPHSPFSEICDFSMLDWHIEVGGLAYFRHATNRVLESKC